MSSIGNGVYYRGFGIKKRYWFGSRSRILGSRPVFMEPEPLGVLPGVPPSRDGYERGELVSGSGSGSGGGGPSRMMKMCRSSSFPIKDDAEYIGYLSDDQSVEEGGSGDEGGMMSVVRYRRRELLGTDISLSDCMLMMITIGCLLMLFLFAVSPWGVPPPRRL